MSGNFRFPSRIYPIVDELDGSGRDFVGLTEAMLAAGARFLQLRVKGRSTRDFIEVARAVKARADAAGAALIVNDRVDVARLVGAAGVHLGQDDLPPAAAREQLGADRIIGFSTHNPAQARASAAQGAADYIGFGPVFATTSKENPDPVVGLDGLRDVRRVVTLPIVAIGGIGVDAVPDVLAAGADAVAMIGAIVLAADVEANLRALLARF
jgi:thiamine-phosphate pyrophosphorylase